MIDIKKIRQEHQDDFELLARKTDELMGYDDELWSLAETQRDKYMLEVVPKLLNELEALYEEPPHGYALVQLPEGQEREDIYGDTITDYLGRPRSMIYVNSWGHDSDYIVQYMSGASGVHYTVAGAREYAAALLAAADEAERRACDRSENS